MSINRVSISGNLTRDPELRTTPSGMAVLSVGVAVNDRRKNNQTGQWEDQANFVDCVVFGQRANSLSNILHKGMKVAIDGKLRYSSWTDQETGRKRSKLEVIVDDLDFMEARGQGGQQQAGYQHQQPAPAPAYQTPAPLPNYRQPAQPAQSAPQAPAQAAAPAPQYQQPQQAVMAPQPAAQAPQQAQIAPPQPLPANQGEPASVYDPDIPF